MNVRLLRPAEIDRQLPQIARLFRASYVPRPWYGSECPLARVFRATLAQHRQLPGFRFAAALPDDGQLVGFGYGHRLAAGQPFRDGLAGRYGASFATHWLDTTSHLVELAVAPARQRAGIGRALHACLLDGLGVGFVLVAAQQQTPGSIFTARLRYETIAFDVWFPPSTDDRYVLRSLRLTQPPQPA